MVYSHINSTNHERMSNAEARDLDNVLTELAKDPQAAETAWLIIKSADQKSAQELKTAFAHISKEHQMDLYRRLKRCHSEFLAGK